jgi:hypothetical protein
MQLTTSLRLCREQSACKRQYALLVHGLGHGWGDDQPIPLTLLLDMHGAPGWKTVSNVLWALQAVPPEQAAARDRVAASYCVDVLGGIPVRILRAFTVGRATIKEVNRAASAASAARAAWKASAARYRALLRFLLEEEAARDD